MRHRTLSFAAGLGWIAQSFKLVRRAPALTAFVSFGYLLTLLLASAIPWLGSLLAAMLMPVLHIGVLEGMRAADRREQPSAEVLFAGFRGPWPALMLIGVLHHIAHLAVAALIQALMDTPLLVPSAKADELPLLNLEFLAWVALLSLPITALYWFAPPLIAWYRVPWPKALFFSFYVVWKNWRALLSWSLGWSGLLLAVAAVVGFVAFFTHAALLYLVLFVLPLVVVPTFFAGYYLQVEELFIVEPPA